MAPFFLSSLDEKLYFKGLENKHYVDKQRFVKGSPNTYGIHTGLCCWHVRANFMPSTMLILFHRYSAPAQRRFKFLSFITYGRFKNFINMTDNGTHYETLL